MFGVDKNIKRERTKFIILSRYRSGSNLLKESLNNIDDVVVYDEAFNLVNLVEDPETYLDPEYVSRVLKHPPERKLAAAGFKLMYGQAFPEELDQSYWGENINEKIIDRIKGIISWLRDRNLPMNTFEHLIDQIVKDKEIRIIHLVRKNQLESYISNRLAVQEDNWKGSKYTIENLGNLEVDPVELLKYFIKGKTYYSFYNEIFKGHKMLEVHYEEFSSGYPKSMKRILNYLDIRSRVKLSGTPLQKQNVYRPEMLVKNYNELYAYFKGSEWEDYF